MRTRFTKIGLACALSMVLALVGEVAMAKDSIPYNSVEGAYVQQEDGLPGVKLADFVTTAQTAVAIANAILCDGIGMEAMGDMAMLGVIYDPASEVWIVEYGPKESLAGEAILGGSVTIALSGKTGQILYMLSGE